MFKYISMHLKSQLEYKSSFILLSVSQILTFLTYCLTFYSLYERFGAVKKFSIYQVMICFSIVQFGESFSEALLRGFDKFSELIKSGKFDLLLIRPQNIYLQVIGSKMELSKITKSFFSILLLIYAIIKLKIYLNPINLLIVLLMLAGSCIIFASIFVLGAALCFKTVEGLEIVNIFVYGTRDFAQYPIGMYNRVIQIFFTYLIPMAIATYFPMLYITGQVTSIWYAVMPLLTLLTLIPSCIIFNCGVKSYKSCGG
ncbi:MAG: ABC-2 family transporter protein [Clostridia bacterium]|nr:ABC-2 family transporter protein [Clostridia bacterium]